jgi:NADH dehydrogenase/NADH:ubiquinone oxidoreductase subunit G
MKKIVQIKINGQTFQVEEGKSVLSVCNENGIDIPALCHNEALEPYGACRLCMVEVIKGPGKKGLTTSCTLKASDGLEIITETDKIVKHRRMLFEFYLAQAPHSEVIKEMAARYGVSETRFARREKPDDPLNNKCILCGQCVRVCDEVMGAAAINYIGRGYLTVVNTPYLEESDVCMGCKACVEVCPTGAIDFEDLDGIRIMKSWSNTKVPLQKCPHCGRFFAPSPMTDFAYENLDSELKAEIKSLCPECRRKVISQKHILAPKGEWIDQ